MTKTETVQLFAIIKSLFPRDEAFKNATPDMITAWAEMLMDIPFDHAKAAVKATVATSPFPPAISEIRDYATRLTTNRRRPADEAWGIASKCCRSIGYKDYSYVSQPYTSEERAAAFMHKNEADDVWAVMQNIGYRDLCKGEPDVVRGQFMRAWTGHDREAKEFRVMGTVIPELFREISGTIELLDGGENGEEL
jgi:hypothetical protein